MRIKSFLVLVLVAPVLLLMTGCRAADVEFRTTWFGWTPECVGYFYGIEGLTVYADGVLRVDNHEAFAEFLEDRPGSSVALANFLTGIYGSEFFEDSSLIVVVNQDYWSTTRLRVTKISEDGVIYITTQRPPANQAADVVPPPAHSFSLLIPVDRDFSPPNWSVDFSHS